MRNALYFFLCFMLFLPAFNCRKDKKASLEPETKEFLNTLWILESFDIEGNIVKPPKDQLYTIQFKEDSTVSGKNDCNDFYANYLITSDDSLRLEQFVTTLMGCGGDQSISDKYVHGLHEAKSYEIHKNRLTIYYETNSKLIFYGE